MTEHDDSDRDWRARPPLAQALLDSARLDEAPRDLEARLAARLCSGGEAPRIGTVPSAAAGPTIPLEADLARARRARRFVLASCAAAAVLIGLGLSRLGERVELQPDTPPLVHVPREPALQQASSVGGPCERPVRVAVDQGLIDDFEDGNSRVFAHAGRSGTWQFVTAHEAGDQARRLTPQLLDSHAGAGRALHVGVPAVSGWGASVVLAFGGCQDVSAFEAIRFRAKGPVQLSVMLNMAEVVARAHGGTCENDCYHAHGRRVTLGERFATHTLRFDEFEQPSTTPAARRVPFRPQSLHGLAFGVAAEDAPSEFWIDDIEFIPREQ